MAGRSETHQVRLGQSFSARGNTRFHTLRYNFKPAHAAFSLGGKLHLHGSTVELNVPSKSNGQLLFTGNSEPYKEVDCVLICNAEGEWRIERLDRNIKNLKVERDVAGPGPSGQSAAEREVATFSTTDASPPNPVPIEEENIDEDDLFGDADDGDGRGER
ncbi:hypothetical protein AB1Y20_023045 [Prymnesium parvum]|uniref:Transcription elongation factor Eaf N-terminal domain-containing protein n=1 Tax=Prymnesium parvum TaxID=97485 RepID=A0AB34JCX4_PRYPA